MSCEIGVDMLIKMNDKVRLFCAGELFRIFVYVQIQF